MEERTMRTRQALRGVGLALLLVPAVLRGDEAEDRAVRTVEDLGGGVKRDEKAPGKPVVSVNLFMKKVTEAALKELAGLKQLRRLNLNGTDSVSAHAHL